jgi:5-methylcytosine-specific restriction endonuclease McrA
MDKIARSIEPAWLAEKYKEWGEDLQAKYTQAGKAIGFEWRQHNNQGYEALIDALSAMTIHHCSFCDAFPMGSTIPNTIEHFRPKSKYPLLAYKWDNLFLCCGICQRKGDSSINLNIDEFSFRFYLTRGC